MAERPDLALGAAFAGLLLGDAVLALLVRRGLMPKAEAVELVDGLILKCEQNAKVPSFEEPWRFAREQLIRTLDAAESLPDDGAPV